ncbi:MAG: adenylate/guanylate cyclase domain-containing protein, partial [Mariprofundus sp.]|nr:adenylate/guanylate cyclase domain-containing protein [Mariprofundus sp.]
MNFDTITTQEKATILVVDDTPENIDVLRGVLKSHYKVKVAINGEQALKLCRSDQPPDLVLLDVMMPGLDGFEVCRRLQAEPATEGMPVIFVTAMNDVHDEVQGFEAGGVDYINKPVTPAIVLSRVRTHLQLRAAYRFIRDTFGRYLSDEIVDQLIDSPEGLKLGGEKRNLSIMMADLRGFTSIGERLPAETVLSMINIFLGRMTEVIQKHQGTIDEFIGDAILAIFGAPVWREDDALRAVRCALEMQLAMQDVNREYLALGYPVVEMGIGIHTGEVIVGNIGSKRRSKYGVVGRVVNTTSRIESYTIGGQILASDSTRAACHDLLRIDAQMEVMPKGLAEPITIYDVGGLLGEQSIALPERGKDEPLRLETPLNVQLMVLSGNHSGEAFAARIMALGRREMEVMSTQACSDYSNLKISITDA